MYPKKLTAMLLLVTSVTLLLGACAPAAVATPVTVATSAPVITPALTEAGTTQAASVAPAVVELNATYENAVSIEQQLILGTLKLEGSNLAISKEQADMLVPLYTNLKTIVESMMPAQGAQPQAISAETQTQIDTIIKDILAAMTPEQVKAISEMQITREIAQTIMTEKGISMGGPGQGRENGQPPDGTPPAGGKNGGAGAPPSDDQNSQQHGGGMIPPELISALIELLKTK